MKEIQCENFDDLIKKMQENGDWGKGTLYRGHADSSWKLTSTLERFVNSNVSVSDYDHWLSEIRAELQSISGQRFDFIWQPIENSKGFGRTQSIFIDLLIYARQHSFPSPVIDFTQSFYIALFFAAHVMQKTNSGKKFSIIATSLDEIDKAEYLKLIDTSDIQIFHKRHYVQQSVYLHNIETDKPTKGNTVEEFFYTRITEVYFRKYSMLNKIRPDIIHELNLMNINPFSIFETDDALMQTLAWKHIPVTSHSDRRLKNSVVSKDDKIKGAIKKLVASKSFRTTKDNITLLESLFESKDKLSPEDAHDVLLALNSNAEIEKIKNDSIILSFYVSRIDRHTLGDEEIEEIYDIIKRDYDSLAKNQ